MGTGKEPAVWWGRSKVTGLAHAFCDALRAQVEAARALCAGFDRGGGLMWPGEVLAAMDGAKSK